MGVYILIHYQFWFTSSTIAHHFILLYQVHVILTVYRLCYNLQELC
jgi:hypothetical protein